jgi:two-component system sensor histidine kinase UhpB
MQREVRSMLGRLRPIGLAEFGLAEAIASLVEFWRRRHPETAYDVSVAPDCGALGDLLDTTIYRVVQEALSNAARHGRPASIDVSITRAHDPEIGPEALVVAVTDDGAGMAETAGVGYGLLGMGERVRALGGRLVFGNRPGGGFAVTAVLPDVAAGAPPAVLPSAAQ